VIVFWWQIFLHFAKSILKKQNLLSNIPFSFFFEKQIAKKMKLLLLKFPQLPTIQKGA